MPGPSPRGKARSAGSTKPSDIEHQPGSACARRPNTAQAPAQDSDLRPDFPTWQQRLESAVPTELADLHSAHPNPGSQKSPKYSICANCNQSATGLLVTFRSRHRGLNRQGSPDHGTGICIRAEAPLAKSSQVSGSVVQWGSPAWRHRPVPFPATGLHLGRLAPSLAPKRQKGSRYSHAELRPDCDSNVRAYCLGGTSEVSPDSAGRGLTCRRAAMTVAGRGLP